MKKILSLFLVMMMFALNAMAGEFPSDSLCHSCKQFEACRSIRQVCYREIVRKYGTDKWYYPDVNCPFAQQHNS